MHGVGIIKPKLSCCAEKKPPSRYVSFLSIILEQFLKMATSAFGKLRITNPNKKDDVPEQAAAVRNPQDTTVTTSDKIPSATPVQIMDVSAVATQTEQDHTVDEAMRNASMSGNHAELLTMVLSSAPTKEPTVASQRQPPLSPSAALFREAAPTMSNTTAYSGPDDYSQFPKSATDMDNVDTASTLTFQEYVEQQFVALSEAIQVLIDRVDSLNQRLTIVERYLEDSN